MQGFWPECVFICLGNFVFGCSHNCLGSLHSYFPKQIYLKGFSRCWPSSLDLQKLLPRALPRSCRRALPLSCPVIWSHLEASGVIWSHLESSAVIWIFFRFFEFLKLMGKSFPHPLGVFCPIPNPPQVPYDAKNRFLAISSNIPYYSYCSYYPAAIRKGPLEYRG